MICLQVVNDRSEAELIRGRLIASGIECTLRSDDAGGTMPHLTLVRGIEIHVPEEQRDRAAQLIAAP